MEKQIKIALAGNPNCGKTTLFNALTGSNQFVGNWPGVTVEKKEGRLKKHDDVVIMDLPGIYSLSPYTLEEVVARNYLIDERPDAILNIVDGTFRMLSEDEIDHSILAAIGGVLAWIFKPLGWGNWQAAVASITGLVAKENIVGTLGILYGGGDGSVYQNIAAAFNGISGYSFLVFNLLCAPCFAAIGAIKREMNSRKWTWFAIGYQCGFAYLVALMIYQFGCAFTGSLNIIGLICAVLALAGIIYMLVRPYKEATTLKA